MVKEVSRKSYLKIFYSFIIWNNQDFSFEPLERFHRYLLKQFSINKIITQSSLTAFKWLYTQLFCFWKIMSFREEAHSKMSPSSIQNSLYSKFTWAKFRRKLMTENSPWDMLSGKLETCYLDNSEFNPIHWAEMMNWDR